MQVYWERERLLSGTLYEREKFGKRYARNYLRKLDDDTFCGEVVHTKEDAINPWRARLAFDTCNICSTYKSAEEWLLYRLQAEAVPHPRDKEALPTKYQTSLKTDHIDLGEEYAWDKGFYGEYLRHIDKDWGTTNLIGELCRVDETLYRGRFKAWHYFHGAVTFPDYETARTWLIQMAAGRVPDEEVKVEPQYLGVHWVREEWIDGDNYAKNYLVSANTEPDGNHELARIHAAKDFTNGFMWLAEISNTVLTARPGDQQFKGSKTLAREHLEQRVFRYVKAELNAPDKTDGSKEETLAADAELFESIKPQLLNYAPTLLEILEKPLKGTIMEKTKILLDEITRLHER
jgi:hypothetical protein